MEECVPDKRWALFLDRDGVINRRIPGGYVRHWEEFHFLEGVLPAIRRLSRHFGPTVIVTNQQGIGKGLMSEDDLKAIHEKMLRAIQAHGGRIDGIYHCPDLAGKANNCRKPAPTMALQAQKDLPGIDFSKSLMVGDTLSDMHFGRSLGMQTAWIAAPPAGKEPRREEEAEGWADYQFESLPALADFFCPGTA